MEENTNIPFFKASINEQDEQAVLSVLRSGWLTTGKECLAFEKEFAAKVKTQYALAVNSNTSGMILAMEACGVAPGTAVITTPYTFVSTAACARHLGADVLFADIEKDTYSIDPNSIEKIFAQNPQKKIVAIVPVHIGGNVCNMERIMRIAKEHKVRVIEDCAHSFPSRTKLGYAGSIGDCGIFSFYATKTITTAEGGMVTTNDEQLCKRMTQMRLHGMDRTTWDRYTSPRASWEYDIIAPGYKFNMPDILAALGRTQLSRADEFDTKRKQHAAFYNRAFADTDFVELPPDSEGNSWHLYLMRLNNEKLDCDRNTFAKELQKAGIGISVHFIPLFQFTYWKNLYKDFTAENYPNAMKAYSRTITLPLWPDMTQQMLERVVQCVKETGERHHA